MHKSELARQSEGEECFRKKDNLGKGLVLLERGVGAGGANLEKRKKQVSDQHGHWKSS